MGPAAFDAAQRDAKGGTSPPVVKELNRADGCLLHPMIMISAGPTRVKPGPLGHRQRDEMDVPRFRRGSAI
jgi:hypothetical protein